MQLAPKVRSLVAQSLMGGVGLGMACVEAVRGGRFEWQVGLIAAVIAGSGFLYGARSLVGQTIARAVSWTVFVPTALYTLSVLLGRMNGQALPIAAGVASALALMISRPLRHTAEAKKAFDPRVLRRWWLATATATNFTAACGAFTALILYSDGGHPAMTGAALAGTTALGASAFGLLRMRTWGVLLAMATTVIGVLATPLLWHDIGPVPLMAGIPGWMMLAGLIAAKTGIAEPKKETVRVAAFDFSEAEAPVRVRVATSELLTEQEEPGASTEARRLTA